MTTNEMINRVEGFEVNQALIIVNKFRKCKPKFWRDDLHDDKTNELFVHSLHNFRVFLMGAL